MAYTPPSIGSAGLTIPTYADILANLLAQFQLIYGQTVYLAADSADYQWISAISLKFADVMQAVQLAYNARSPLTAVGSDLDAIVKLNGLVRKPATFSTAVITVVGTAGSVIPAGVMADANGYYWDLPSNTTIPGGGSIAVTATCETPGVVTRESWRYSDHQNSNRGMDERRQRLGRDRRPIDRIGFAIASATIDLGRPSVCYASCGYDRSDRSDNRRHEVQRHRKSDRNDGRARDAGSLHNGRRRGRNKSRGRDRDL
jgi:hypothetical protein